MAGPTTSPQLIEYQYRVIAEHPHATNVFTQGLEYHNGLLYESAGQYGESALLTRSLDSSTPLQLHRLDKRLFAEGLTLLNNRLYQLSWKSQRGFIYRPNDLQPIAEFNIHGEGWGMTHNDQQLIISNGSNLLQFINPVDFTVSKTLAVTFEGKALHKLNELEWIDGLIYANIWQSHWIVMIDPASGHVVGKVYLKDLLPKKLRTARTDVLNGIAYDRNNKRLLVTGKYWPRIYHIELSR